MLSKDAKKMLYVIYKEYLSKRKNNISKSKSKIIGSALNIQQHLFKNWTLEDVEETMRELDRNKFLDYLYADNTIHFSKLTDYAIATMENQKKEIFLNITDFITKFIP